MGKVCKNDIITREESLLEGVLQCFVRKEGLECRTIYIAGEDKNIAEKLQSFDVRYREANPTDKVMHITGNGFCTTITNFLNNSLSPDHYSHMLYDCDLLIFEGIEAKHGSGTIGELLYTIFDHVYEHGGRIVVSGKKLPKEMYKMEDRNRTQLEGGIVVSF